MYMVKRNKWWYIPIGCLVFLGLIFLLFRSDSEEQVSALDNTEIRTSELTESEKLARQYCSGCHRYPDPAILPKRTWRSQSLPQMGPLLGIFEHGGETYPLEDTPGLPDNYYPEQAMLSSEEWQKILDFYVQKAPEKLMPAEPDREIIHGSLFFTARTPAYREQAPPMVSAIKLDPANRLIYLSNASRNSFMIFDSDLKLTDRFSLTSPMADIRFADGGRKPGRRRILMTYIGSLSPSDAPEGFVTEGWYDPETGAGSDGIEYADSLVRPVEMQTADLDDDGEQDILINEYGHRTGKLFWLKKKNGEIGPEQRVLIDTPGCIESHITDHNDDGLPDIITLCAQLDQTIYLLLNRGEGRFDRKKLLEFKVTAGSSSFELYDFNNDGHTDILYTSGDNADFSQIYKPYHGAYIFLNDGEDHFTQAWFYPINGAYKAIARDFDKDGNTDIAVNAFFADFETRPEEGFVFFRGEGGLNFTPYHPPETSGGRWIAMDVADWTGNGYDDIVLANFSLGPTRVAEHIQNRFTGGPHFLLLENRSGSISGRER